jgi:NAD(P)H-dependent flavin oxidoreductase YrpB (nitropropane dioxygenase family)
MAGDAGTVALAVAAGQSGGLGFVAGGYKSAEALAGQITEVRSAGIPFGVNLFAPSPLPVEPEAFRRYAEALKAEFDAYGIVPPAASPIEDDDAWRQKVDILLADPVPLVSFTFGIPDAGVLAALRARGTVVVQTVTSAAEATAAAEAGADVLAVRASVAGGHSGTLTPRQPPPAIPLPDLVARVLTRLAGHLGH